MNMTESRYQLLFSRVVDGEESTHDWQEFVSFAENHPQLWRELALSQRDYIAMINVVEATDEISESIEISDNNSSGVVEDGSGRLHMGNWTGWAIAALVAVVAGLKFYSQPTNHISHPQSFTQRADVIPISNPLEAFQTYLDTGRETGLVLGEVPERLLIETNPIESGDGYELIYVRQVLERAVVPDLYQVGGYNDLGQPTLIRYTNSERGSM